MESVISRMSLPPWITEQLEGDEQLQNKLTQRDIVEAMYRAERPFFTLQQIHQRVEPDVSKVTVRNRLDELAEREIVKTDTSADSLTLYYINHPESEWPLSPEGKQALKEESNNQSSPLFAFLQRPQVRRILSEELWRSVAWAALGLFGWAIIISESGYLEANALTVLGLPILTWASLTVGMIGFRLTTGHELQVQMKEGLHIVVLGGYVLAAFWAIFFILTLDYSPVLVIGLYLVIGGAYLIYYIRMISPRFDSAPET